VLAILLHLGFADHTSAQCRSAHVAPTVSWVCAEADVKALDLVGLTLVAERTITSDLEYLIEKAVDTSNSNYAVFSGVQVWLG